MKSKEVAKKESAKGNPSLLQGSTKPTNLLVALSYSTRHISRVASSLMATINDALCFFR